VEAEHPDPYLAFLPLVGFLVSVPGPKAGDHSGRELDHPPPARYAGEVSMLVRQAEAAARHWVIEKVSTIPGFHGAYVAGSANGLPDNAVVPATSDVDINVVLSGPSTRNMRAKLFYRDLLLDVTPLSLERF